MIIVILFQLISPTTIPIFLCPKHVVSSFQLSPVQNQYGSIRLLCDKVIKINTIFLCPCAGNAYASYLL